ncbi:MAG: hypothetical protein ACLS58_10195, partial [Sutterella wadsworthensis]
LRRKLFGRRHRHARGRPADVMLVPLIGIMFGNVVMGVTGFLAHRFDMTQAMASWSVGHFSMVMQGRYELVWLAVPLIALILHRLRCGRRALTLANVKSLFTFTSTSASTPGAR